MKKTYTTPDVERIRFNYHDQVVAASSDQCISVWVNIGVDSCTEGNAHYEKYNNA